MEEHGFQCDFLEAIALKAMKIFKNGASIPAPRTAGRQWTAKQVSEPLDARRWAMECTPDDLSQGKM
jgi:hypothetical protein